MKSEPNSVLKYLQTTNRFFMRQVLYPLVLASLLCLVLFVLRVLYSHRPLEYRNLVWNLFLAWIPYLTSMAAAVVNKSSSHWRSVTLPVLGIIWLLFIPNAPYMVTDFLHLEHRPPVPIWYDIGLVSCFAFTGILLAVISLHTMHSLVEEKLGWLVGWVFAFTILPLCGLGVYLGRFGRFNSWDFLLHPKAILKEIARPILDPLENMRFIGFTLMFTAILIVFYLAFTALSERRKSH